VDDHAVARRHGDGLPDAAGLHGQELGRRPWLDPDRGQSHHVAGHGAHRVVGLVGQEVAGHDEQGRGLQGVAPADQVERVLQVVRATRHRDAGGHQRPDGRQTPRRRTRCLAPLEVEVGLGQRDHTDSGRRHLVGDRLLRLPGLHAEADAVAGRDAVGEARRPHTAGQVPQSQYGEVERLVGVEVDHVAAPGCQVQKHLVRSDRVVVEIRAATDDVGTGGERLAHERPVVRAGPPGHRPCDQGHDLKVDQVAEAAARLHQPFHGPQAVTGHDVGVRPDGGRAVGHHEPRGALGPLGDVLDGEALAVGVHGLDRAQEVALRVQDALGQEGLVEVGMRLDRCRQEHIAVEVEDGLVR
jgi:hypothetical protein